MHATYTPRCVSLHRSLALVLAAVGLLLAIGVGACGPETTRTDLTAWEGDPCDGGLGGDGYACNTGHTALLRCPSTFFTHRSEEFIRWERVCTCAGTCRVTEISQSGFGLPQRRVETECDCIGAEASVASDGRHIAGL